jgi:hypothetical protein
MSRKPTKTEREFMNPFDQLVDDIDRTHGSEPLTMAQLKKLISVCLSNQLSDESVSEELDAAFQSFEYVCREFPEAEPHVTHGVTALVVSVLHNRMAVACEQIEVEASRAMPKRKTAAKERAWQIATQLWEADTEKKIRIGEMADKVYKALLSEGFADQLPGNSEQLTKWLKQKKKEFPDQFPDHASRGGR